MSTPSLGEILRSEVIGKKASCLLALEQQTAEKGQCALRDLQHVKDFFHQATTQFTGAILARIEVQPMILGNAHNEAVAMLLQTYRWKDGNGMTQACHPYHAVWQAFDTWCRENDLTPKMEYRCDPVRKQAWHLLTVSPALH